jgi:syntaxin 16
LAKLHNERLKVTFGRTEDDLDKKIELMTRQITTLFRKCEASVKRVVPTQEELKKMTQPMSPQEVDMRRNVMKGMATKITDESKKFREMQKDFLSKMKKREDFPAEFGIRDDDEGKDGHITIEDIMEKGLTAEQVVELDALRKRGAEREAQIVQIAKSVNELAQMFKELSVLIVEQGSIIDRIDYNIEQAQIHVRDGVKEVQIAKKHQDKATGFSWFCIAALVIAIIVCIIILAEVKSKSS